MSYVKRRSGAAGTIAAEPGEVPEVVATPATGHGEAGNGGREYALAVSVLVGVLVLVLGASPLGAQVAEALHHVWDLVTR